MGDYQDEGPQPVQYPLSLAITTGWRWAEEHGVKHNHRTLFQWNYGCNPYGEPHIGIESACAVGFGWIGCEVLSGTPDGKIMELVYKRHTQSAEGEPRIYDYFIAMESEERFACPHDGCRKQGTLLSDMVIHINDEHHWGVVDIADWAAAQEPDELRLEIAPAVLEVPQQCALGALAVAEGWDMDFDDMEEDDDEW